MGCRGHPHYVLAVCTRSCGASGLGALQLLQFIDSKTLYDACDREYSGLKYLLNKKAQQQRQVCAETGVMYDAALIMLGTNDLTQQGITAHQIVAAITQLHTVCHSFGVRTVALPILPNFWSCTPREDLVAYRTMRQQVNCLLEEWTVQPRLRCVSHICIGTCKQGKPTSSGSNPAQICSAFRHLTNHVSVAGNADGMVVVR